MMTSLPVDSYLADIDQAVRERFNLVISAEPGAGKTTRIPRALMPLAKRVYVLEPRRLAAKLSAERVAKELGEGCGQRVGYMVRYESKYQADTKLIYVTEGIMVRLLTEDPYALRGCICVLDEFHERSVNTDLVLAMLHTLQKEQETDLRVVVMSATLDTEVVSGYLNNPKIFRIPGRTFPLTVEYLPPPDTRTYYLDWVCEGIYRMAEDSRTDGHILVFLTGRGDIAYVSEKIKTKARISQQFAVFALSAETPSAEQARVFATGGGRKIILSTNVAETSVTVPGVRAVIDCGFVKQSAFATWSGLPTLDTKRCSKASCIQRAGRAGREAEGLVYRMYSEHDFMSREEFTVPEIRRADLNQVFLETKQFLKKIGRPSSGDLRWFEMPDAKKWEYCRNLLTALGALDANGDLTEEGEFFLTLPLHPRLSALVYEGKRRGILVDAIMMAAIINEGFLFKEGLDATAVTGCDLSYQVEVLKKSLYDQRSLERSVSSAVHPRRLDAVKSAVTALASTLRVTLPRDTLLPPHEDISTLLLTGYFDRVAKRIRTDKRNADRFYYSFCNGGGGILAKQSTLQGPDLIIALEAREKTSSKQGSDSIAIWYASEVSAAVLCDASHPLYISTVEKRFNEKSGQHEMWEQQKYGQLLIQERRASVASEGADLLQELQASWPKPFESLDDLIVYHARLRLMKSVGYGDEFPLFEGEMLELLQHAMVEGKRSLREVAAHSLRDYIEEQMSYESLQQLNKMLPLQIRLKGERSIPVHYSLERPPYVQGFIQDFYGVQENLSLADGRIPLVYVLLAPNKRPAQTTSDLVRFWQSGYSELKKEYSRTYPRHFWPDKPETAVPKLHLKPRSR